MLHAGSRAAPAPLVRVLIQLCTCRISAQSVSGRDPPDGPPMYRAGWPGYCAVTFTPLIPRPLIAQPL